MGCLQQPLEFTGPVRVRGSLEQRKEERIGEKSSVTLTGENVYSEIAMVVTSVFSCEDLDRLLVDDGIGNRSDVARVTPPSPSRMRHPKRPDGLNCSCRKLKTLNQGGEHALACGYSYGLRLLGRAENGKGAREEVDGHARGTIEARPK